MINMLNCAPQVARQVDGGRPSDGAVDPGGQDQATGDHNGGVREHPRRHGRALHWGQHRQDDRQALD